MPHQCTRYHHNQFEILLHVPVPQTYKPVELSHLTDRYNGSLFEYLAVLGQAYFTTHLFADASTGTDSSTSGSTNGSTSTSSSKSPTSSTGIGPHNSLYQGSLTTAQLRARVAGDHADARNQSTARIYYTGE